MKSFTNDVPQMNSNSNCLDYTIDERVFNLDTRFPYFTKENGDYFGKLKYSN